MKGCVMQTVVCGFIVTRQHSFKYQLLFVEVIFLKLKVIRILIVEGKHWINRFSTTNK